MSYDILLELLLKMCSDEEENESVLLLLLLLFVAKFVLLLFKFGDDECERDDDADVGLRLVSFMIVAPATGDTSFGTFFDFLP